MRRCYAALGHLFLLFAFTPEEALGSENSRCKRFQVIFDKGLEAVPTKVYLRDTVIGAPSMEISEDDVVRSLEVCIDERHVHEFEQNTICYVLGDKLLVYNIWSTGERLPEHGQVRGLSGKTGLFWYELKLFLGYVRDTLTRTLGWASARTPGRVTIAAPWESAAWSWPFWPRPGRS